MHSGMELTHPPAMQNPLKTKAEAICHRFVFATVASPSSQVLLQKLYRPFSGQLRRSGIVAGWIQVAVESVAGFVPEDLDLGVGGVHLFHLVGANVGVVLAE